MPGTTRCLTAFGQTPAGCLSIWPNHRNRRILRQVSRLDIPISWCIDASLTRSEIFFPHIHLTIALSVLYSRRWSSTVTGQVSLAWSRTALTHAENTSPRCCGDIALLVRMGRSSLKLFHEDLILAVTASAQPPVFPVTSLLKVAEVRYCLKVVLYWLFSWGRGRSGRQHLQT